jgi:squalene-hopene/tetraprenyl-beta-curcumene cyclase
VVSYALPALVALGQLLHRRRPAANRGCAVLRELAVEPTLRRLAAIQPLSGGFLEATPLTSFVVMSLAAANRADHGVVRRGVEFLQSSARPDGSWPIDVNLTTWVTTQAVEALSIRETLGRAEELTQWLIGQQHTGRHPFTHSDPGGWAWTDLPGGVPDADDTAGALLALGHLGTDAAHGAVRAGINWLLDLQNADGGWPTFCRGWGKLPFDRGAPDLTAHAICAVRRWHGIVAPARERLAIRRAFGFLRRAQKPDGSWEPLWFGNQHAPDHANPVYGAARVLAAYRVFGRGDWPQARSGADFLLRAQNADGGWGGAGGVPSSVEETALATREVVQIETPRAASAAMRGCAYLVSRINEGGLDRPVPIALYFARLWYSEELYPVVWSVAALGTALARASSDDAFLKAGVRQ